MSKKIYSSIDSDFPEERALPVVGELPAWLSGNLFRTGPGRYEAVPGGDRVLTHLFDGYALVQKVSFARGSAAYRSRLVRSGSLVEAEQAGRPVRSEFGGSLSFLGRLQSAMAAPIFTDNPNVNIQRVAGQREYSLFCAECFARAIVFMTANASPPC